MQQEQDRVFEEEKLIYMVNGYNTFVKVKGNSLNIGKVLFSFVEYNRNKKEDSQEKNIDIYMDTAKALLFAEKILTGEFFRAAAISFNEGEQYPRAFWQSPLGGINEQKAKERGLRADGKAISRNFNIAVGAKRQDGSRFAFVITAMQRPGNTEGTGIIVPESGKPEKVIRVPIIDNDTMRELALMLRANINGYYAAYYSGKK